MFVPPIYRVTDPGQLHQIIRQHPMAMLVGNGPTTPYTTLLPIIHLPGAEEPEAFAGFSLLGHLNRANPHWRALAGGAPASLVFTGPNSYVTPALYDTPVAAPTWNFATAELTGDVVPLSEGEETLEVVRRTAELFERRFGQGWEAGGSVDYFRSIVSGVGAFRFDVTSGQAMFKLSQEKNPAIRDRVAKSMLDDGDGTRRALGVHMCRMGRTETTSRPTLWGGSAEPECLLDGLARTVAERPDELALVDGATRLTYAELWAWVAELAATLTRHGIEPGSRVAVTGGRSARTVAALLAAVAVGATYVPLDASYPVNRLTFMLHDSGASLLLHDGPRPTIADEVATLAIEDPSGAGAGDFRPVACRPDLPVYVIYTSGSTGLPKGVTIQHSCLDNMAAWQRTDSVRPDLRTAQFAPLNFDVCFQEILGTLCGGGTLVIVPETLRRDPFAFLTWLADHRIERLFLPYVALHMLAVAASAQDGDLGLSLREVNTAGEQLLCTPPIRALFEALPQARLGNHYGQSESAMVSSYVLPADPAAWPLLPPIGRPLPGCELLVNPTDPEDPTTGELLVAGAPVSLGYLGRPELNAERFITVDPTPQGHTKAFRTGDLVRVEDDLVYFLSRLDHDVKIRGIRVNLLEIEACLMQQPGVATAVCVALEPVPGSRQLRAAVTLHPDVTEPGDLRAALAELLPEASVPASVTILPGLPRTPSGKIDRDSVAESLATKGDR
ncbi:AMP-binding protein [Streptomyces sp. NBC_01275]|uniref:AMP-binding protein n=1 Tax=Streptomyces sp. NBC_01275 TaxID=2903807 RepID=UPI002251D7A9|nr:AMP-binding protein [Streptomyces sp. NBC_01275]MCX4762826.1 AMP-binding protein [Streptomyces sp. NBC_01275]